MNKFFINYNMNGDQHTFIQANIQNRINKNHYFIKFITIKFSFM